MVSMDDPSGLERHLLWDDPPPAPEVRRGDLAAKLLREPVHPRLHLALAHDAALPTRPCADLRAEGARVEVLLALCTGHALGAADDSDLLRDLLPVEVEGGARVLSELARLARGVVGEEDEAVRVDLLEEDRTRGGHTGGGRGGDRHRLGLVDGALDGREPLPELRERIGEDGRGGEVVWGVVLLVCGHFERVRGRLGDRGA